MNDEKRKKQEEFDAWRRSQGMLKAVHEVPEEKPKKREPKPSSAYGVEFWIIAFLTFIIPMIGFLVGLIRVFSDVPARKKQGGSLIAMSFAFGFLNFALLLSSRKSPALEVIKYIVNW
jgi:hypothetical protein